MPPEPSVTLVLLQPGFVLMFMYHVATKAMGMPGVWAATCRHFGVLRVMLQPGSYRTECLHYHRCHVWAHGPTVARVCIDVCGS